MLFNSYAFLLVFLPLTLAAFHGLRVSGRYRGAIGCLVLCSLFFYGYWDPIYLLLLAPLILFNFAIARLVAPQEGDARRLRKPLLLAGIAVDLGCLAWFKYANFVVAEGNAFLGTQIELASIVLPLGISFFTFQMIASLVDSYQGKVERFGLLDYALFVTFFPQLIAGPIVHHSEMMPQFAERPRVDSGVVAMALTILTIGLVKKVLLADSVAPYASARFDAAAAGEVLGVLDAWAAALAYTAQLYFDFSGYSDMAIGAALLFGIRLPINFASPYKAANIVDFWRRWHITLSRFLRDYLYIPLGGNRHGKARRYLNLFITMLLGGIWHGAGWTFLIWGALHGTYLAVNHAWQACAQRWGIDLQRSLIGRECAWLLTFLAVVVGWVFFRAAGLGTATGMLSSMAGTAGGATASYGDTGEAFLVAGSLLLFARFAPNTQELTGYRGADEAPAPQPAAGWGWPRWRPTPAWAMATGMAIAITLMSLSRVSEFLYFQF